MRYFPTRNPWPGPLILMLFCWHLVIVVPLLYAVVASSVVSDWFTTLGYPRPEDPTTRQQVELLGTNILATPITLTVGYGLRRLFGYSAALDSTDRGGWISGVALGTMSWFVVTPMVFGIHFATLFLVHHFGGTLEQHPLTILKPDTSIVAALIFALSVCVMTPLAEEFLFRGLLVRWAAGRSFRPGILLLVAFGVSILAQGSSLKLAPPLFILVLVLGWGIWSRVGSNWRRGPRMWAGIYASSALFAAAHSAVWPSPIPLFVLGLALGWMCDRSHGIVACVTLHGLFNAVSFVFLLRGGST